MIPTYILTIDSEDGLRRKHSLDECHKLGLAANFVTGPIADESLRSSVYSKYLNLLFLKRSMTDGEIACYEGHRRTWRKMIANDNDVALVCEDDFSVVDKKVFQEALSSALKRHDWDILKFFDFSPKPIMNRVALSQGCEIVDYKYAAAGAVCYLIRQSAARKLLHRRFVFRPVDEDFLHCWEFPIRVRSVSPNLVEEVSYRLGGSTLEESRSYKKSQKSLARSIWGIFLTIWKQFRAKLYRKKLRG